MGISLFSLEAEYSYGVSEFLLFFPAIFPSLL